MTTKYNGPDVAFSSGSLSMASAGSLEHMPGKGLLSLWPVLYAVFSSASAAGQCYWLDTVVSEPFDLTLQGLVSES